MIVCDEAHKMSATMWGGEVKYTKRYQLGRLLSSITRHFLLLILTVHRHKHIHDGLATHARDGSASDVPHLTFNVCLHQKLSDPFFP